MPVNRALTRPGDDSRALPPVEREERPVAVARVGLRPRGDGERLGLLDLVAGECQRIADAGLGSCEMIAEQLATTLKDKWPKRRVACTVSEDGEAGASVVLLP